MNLLSLKSRKFVHFVLSTHFHNSKKHKFETSMRNQKDSFGKTLQSKVFLLQLVLVKSFNITGDSELLQYPYFGLIEFSRLST